MGIDLTIADATQESGYGCPIEAFRGTSRKENEEFSFRASAAFRLQFAQDMLAAEPVQPEPEGLAADKLHVLGV